MKIVQSCHFERARYTLIALAFTSAVVGHAAGLGPALGAGGATLRISKCSLTACDLLAVGSGAATLVASRFRCPASWCDRWSDRLHGSHENRWPHLLFLVPLCHQLLPYGGSAGALAGELIYRSSLIGAFSALYWTTGNPKDKKLSRIMIPISLIHLAGSPYIQLPVKRSSTMQRP